MTEIWESSFMEHPLMWGLEPSDSAILAKDFFLDKELKNILIPGIGYGRNAKVFVDHGMQVTGIEISRTAIDLAQQEGLDCNIFHGFVSDMPFDDSLYDGIFCYALIHLLDEQGRAKFIQDCFNQLKPNGYMMFVTISKKAPMYGKGKPLGKDYFEVSEGVNMYFYDVDSIDQEFGPYGLLDISEIAEPHKNKNNKLPFMFTRVLCKKGPPCSSNVDLEGTILKV